uniref:(California timema) hypothetical protein n=1 Tax=Timema californicum TaxID=61474 RepID=A0A7R9PA18_TIMCA|nr:unnamed protein product [Timema californicum]
MESLNQPDNGVPTTSKETTPLPGNECGDLNAKARVVEVEGGGRNDSESVVGIDRNSSEVAYSKTIENEHTKEEETSKLTSGFVNDEGLWPKYAMQDMVDFWASKGSYDLKTLVIILSETRWSSRARLVGHVERDSVGHVERDSLVMSSETRWSCQASAVKAIVNVLGSFHASTARVPGRLLTHWISRDPLASIGFQVPASLAGFYCEQVLDSDTSLWLHNKLGTSNDSWTGGSICSQLNSEVLRNIKDCFPELQTQVKLKLLLSFFHIPRRNVEEWQVELEEILEVAQLDSEQWVSMLAEGMKTLPATGSLNTEIGDVDENRRIFSDLVNDLRKLVRKQTELSMLPLECHYLNKSALLNVVGQQPLTTKHFTLKRRPKSAALRAELLQKSTDAASNMKKSTAPTLKKSHKITPHIYVSIITLEFLFTAPLKGIPSRVPTGGFRSPTLNTSPLARPPIPRNPAGRKDGGIKLLEITEQPLGYAQAKKRKRMQELEESKKASEAAAAQQQLLQQNNPSAAGAQNTPDYAVGLTAMNPPTPAPATPSYTASATTIITLPRDTSRPNQSPKYDCNQSPQLPATTHNVGREQMLEAQEMFRTANKVTRPEKALILGFMAGARDNPCPHLGNIVTIKLSENPEDVLQTDHSSLLMLVETHFQMNYNTGEWKRIKKVRNLEDITTSTPITTLTAAPAATAT